MEKQKIFENVWIRALAIVCVLALFFTLCYFLKGILISLFLAFTIAYIFDPVADYISKRKLIFSKRCVPRGLAIAILLTLVFLVMGGLLTYTVPKTVNGVQRVGTKLKSQYPKYQEQVIGIVDKFEGTELGAFLKLQLENKEGKTSVARSAADENFRIPQLIRDLRKHVPQVMNVVLGAVKDIFYSTFGFIGVIVNIIVFGVVTVYLLNDFNTIISKGNELLPSTKKDKIVDIVSKIDGNLKAFFRGQMTVCAILSIIYGIGLTAIGIPMSFLLAFVGGFGNMIPYVGIGFGLIPAIVLAFIQYQDITHILLVGLVFGIGQFLEGTLITPKIVGTKLGLNPVAIILSILICGEIFGFLGLLLAVPIASVVKVLIDEGIIKYKETKLFKGS
ncbi:MAG: AI-2E family transporter [Candidatus Scalindua sp.]|jgi:predicted PurR-regulated permease PerM|nr:AI-2E family transporter [Candidatus Scalindua sp.]MBT5306073.1 AI-2E family transporter [Candidatus Scalindua sp.]MBT6052471.1 AI-2E family transporter [Candidatus Scalindua sp.]MBT6227138.1 AI-2E family transporter [Candidatus Scalindua sp.]MBT6562113.1 AI-2E family transporter [Candidatus Scalindua sp.]